MTGPAHALTPDAPIQRAVFYLVAVAAALMPLEPFLIALLARTGLFPGRALFAMQFAIEGAIYIALAIVILTRLVMKRGLHRTPADAPLLVILAIVCLTVAINNAPLKPSLMNLRSALRYAALFYLVTQAGLSRKQVAAVLWVILIGGALQLLIGAAQWAVGYDLKIKMLPYTSDIEVAGQARRFALVERGREIGSLFGTLGDTLYYGLFMLVALTVALSRTDRWHPKFLIPILFSAGAVAYSYSRAAVIVMVVTLAAFVAGRLGARRVAGGCCALLAVGVLLLAGSMIMETHGGTYHHPRQGRRSILTNMTNIFSPEYLERSKRQRLGTLLGVAPTTLMNAPVIGFGPDQMHAIKQLNESRKTRLYKTLTKEGFEDVYWVAILCYTGIIGVLAVLWLGVRLAWTCAAIVRASALSGSDAAVRWAGLAGLCIVIQMAALMWFNRVPEVRAFSFYFWLLPALAYAARAELQHDTQPTDTPPASATEPS